MGRTLGAEIRLDNKSEENKIKLSRHCYAVTGLYFSPPWTVNAGFIIGSKKTLVIDSGSNTISAQTIYGYSKSLKPKNELVLINTEKHLDHIGGNSYFHDNNVEIYGHQLIDRTQNEFDDMVYQENSNIAEENRRIGGEGWIAYHGTKIINPINKISKNMHFDLGGIVAHVRMTPGHTETNISVIIESDKVVYSGDCVLNTFVPNIDGANIEKWRESLNILLDYQTEILVPGHGNVIIGREKIVDEIKRIDGYLQNCSI